MAAIAWSDVVALAPELANTNALTQTDVLNYVNGGGGTGLSGGLLLNLTLYDGEAGMRTRLARIYLAAHFASMPRLGSGGPLIGESAAGLSRQYGLMLDKSKLALTGYGQAFLAMMPPAARGPQVC